MVQLAELSDWCISNNVPARDRIEKVKGLTSIISLDEDICFEGSRIKNQRRKKGFRKFSLLDGLVLAAARTVGERVLTLDQDFDGEDDCLILS